MIARLSCVRYCFDKNISPIDLNLFCFPYHINSKSRIIRHTPVPVRAFINGTNPPKSCPKNYYHIRELLPVCLRIVNWTVFSSCMKDRKVSLVQIAQKREIPYKKISKSEIFVRNLFIFLYSENGDFSSSKIPHFCIFFVQNGDLNTK